MDERQTGQLVDRDELLAKFDLISEADVATLLGVSLKTLKNRARGQQPVFSRVGRHRLYSRQAVLDYIAAREVDATTRLRAMRVEPRANGANEAATPATVSRAKRSPRRRGRAAR